MHNRYSGSDEYVQEALRALFEREIANMPVQHRANHGKCLAVSRFDRYLTKVWTEDERLHVQQCTYCRLLLARSNDSSGTRLLDKLRKRTRPLILDTIAGISRAPTTIAASGFSMAENAGHAVLSPLLYSFLVVLKAAIDLISRSVKSAGLCAAWLGRLLLLIGSGCLMLACGIPFALNGVVKALWLAMQFLFTGIARITIRIPVPHLFACSHRRTTFPISRPRLDGSFATIVGHCYVVCLDCGKEFEYDWANMQLSSCTQRDKKVAAREAYAHPKEGY